MPEAKAPDYTRRKRRHHAEDPERRRIQRANQHDAQPVPAGASHGSPLLNDARLLGRGNEPVREAMVQKMQQTHGNRAVQRLLKQKTRGGTSPASPPKPVNVQRNVGMLGALGTQNMVAAKLLNDETVKIAQTGGTVLPADFVRAALALDKRQDDPAFDAAYKKAAGAVLAYGEGAAPLQARELIRMLEHRFINDPNTSSLDLLPPKQRDRYRDFAWDVLDFPGHTKGQAKGPNERRATSMAANLDAIRPERRANFGDFAVVTKKEHDKEMQEFIKGELDPISGGGGRQLNRTALESFEAMREAAEADGVTLTVVSAYRTPESSQKRAAKSGNKAAIADFSSHNLGLAIDLRMSHGKQRFLETRTTPMQNVVDMRESPVHKWMFLKGASFGWFPYHNEPWHWEYNPAGFREQFHERMEAQAQLAAAAEGLATLGKNALEGVADVAKGLAGGLKKSFSDFL